MTYGQLSIFDIDPRCRPDPQPGEWVKEHGQVIRHIMRRSYIGKKIVMDKSTQSQKAFKVGILERVDTSFYYRGDQKIECDRSVIYDGSRQRSYILHMPGQEIYELYPFDMERVRINHDQMRHMPKM